MNTQLIGADGSAYDLSPNGWALLLGAAVAFGWEPMEFASLGQPSGRIDSPEDWGDHDCSDPQQSNVDLAGALERVLAAIAANAIDRDKELAAGITARCYQCQEAVRHARLCAIEPFDDAEGLLIISDLVTTLKGSKGIFH